ncbi:hypothetical protein, partial [Treponema sp. R8-4-B8]
GVAPFTGAEIETARRTRKYNFYPVAPIVDAGIETTFSKTVRHIMSSRALRGRGDGSIRRNLSLIHI